LRDRLGAHRQPVGGEDDVGGWVPANELWAQIDAPLVGVLCEDMAEIEGRVRRLTGAPEVSAPVLTADQTAAIAAAAHFLPVEGLRVATGSFGETMINAMTPLQGGAIGERLREVSDTIDGWECYATARGCVRGSRPFERALAAGAVIETANLVELVYEVPAGRAPANRYPPLLELIPHTYAERAELQTTYARLSATDRSWLRERRNTVAAHLDARERLSVLLKRLDETEPERLDRLFHSVCKALVEIDRRHPITVWSTLVRTRNKQMAGVMRVEPPEYPAGYNG
jgi:hypothetical protein